MSKLIILTFYWKQYGIFYVEGLVFKSDVKKVKICAK